MPVPPPTPPSATGPGAAASIAANEVLGLHVHAVDVVQVAVPGLGHDRQRPDGPARRSFGRPAARRVGDDRVAHDAHRVRVGDGDRAPRRARIPRPSGSPSSRRCRSARSSRRSRAAGRRRPAAGQDGGHAGAHDVAFDERRVADLDAGHVGDRVLPAGRAEGEGDAEVARARRSAVPGRRPSQGRQAAGRRQRSVWGPHAGAILAGTAHGVATAALDNAARRFASVRPALVAVAPAFGRRPPTVGRFRSWARR